MGNKNKQRSYENRATAADAERAASATRLNTGSEEYKPYADRIRRRRAAIDAGDINNAPDFIGNSASQALINRKREAVYDAAPTGVQAIGNNYADPKQMAVQTQMLKDMQARDSGAQLESDWRNYIADTQDAEAGIVSRRDNIDMTLMSDAGRRSSEYDAIARQIAQQRQNMWAGILGAGIGGAASVFSGGFAQGGRFSR